MRMRFRLGLMIGFGAGYYLGAMGGRERYEQINRTIRKVKRSEVYDTATDKARAVVDLGVERARDLVESKLHNGESHDVPDLTTTQPYVPPTPTL
ncbi:MAG TPA: hypothetical protein VFA94_02850 [Acidimicrobiales bacterium]|nr:hypothetical protein [Acidimicrobiales bacterium]